MTRRQMFAALFGAAPLAAALPAVVDKQTGISIRFVQGWEGPQPPLMMVTPICPWCGLIPAIDRTPMFPGERVPASCMCGWRGSVPLEVAIP